MIPAQLKLENFMCFSNIEIDFSNLKTACLTGKNGSGKSSVLDAITWALWEMGRAKSDKLIKLGMNNMTVELEFLVEDVRYKVIRNYQKASLNNPKKGAKTLLDFYYFDKKRKTWQPYTAKNLKDTQDRINNIIKLEYEAFVNSIYIRQGDVDSFISKSPEARKRVLAEILGLGEYERLYQKSMAKAEQLKVHAKVLKEQINEGEIKQFSLKKLQSEKDDLVSDIHSIQERLNSVIQNKKDLESKNNRYKVLVEQRNLYSNIKNKYEDDIIRTAKYIETIRQSIEHFKDIIAIEDVIKNKYKVYLHLKEKLKDLDEKELEYHRLKDRLIECGSKQMIKRYGAEHEFKKICETLDNKLEELEICRKIIAESPHINKKYIEYQEIKKQLDNLANFRRELADIEIKITRLQAIIDRFTFEYQTWIDTLKEIILEIDHKVSKKEELKNQIAQLEKEIKQYDKYEAELERIREKGIVQREVIFDRTNKNNYIETDLDKLKEKINLLQSNNKNSKCPTCSNKVVNSNDIVRKLEFEIDNLMFQVECNENDISIAEDEMKFLRIAYKEKKKYLSKRSNLIFELAELQTDLKNLELEEIRLQELKQELNELHEKMMDASYAEEERYQIKVLARQKQELQAHLDNFETLTIKCNDLSYIEEAFEELNVAKEKAQVIENELPFFTMSKRNLEKELNNPMGDDRSKSANDAYSKLLELDYDIQKHIELREQLASSQEIEYDYLNLQFAHEQIPFLKSNEAQFSRTLDTYYEEIGRVTTTYDDLNTQINQAEDLKGIIEDLDDKIEKLSAELNNCNCNLAVINDRTASVEDLLLVTKEKRKELDSVNNDISHYIELANAFGEKGIQDIIIENALPEIEEEANNFLAKLTDDQMRISLKSSKRNKTGDAAERLDIYIADDQGTRSYELYSGGETFRINFAIRIALSKLLAKSRGVKLQTLIIDDAFGSQDFSGKEKLANIINLIKDDFEMILIVTHNEEIVEFFPGRIELSKESGQSIVKVVA